MLTSTFTPTAIRQALVTAPHSTLIPIIPSWLAHTWWRIPGTWSGITAAYLVTAWRVYSSERARGIGMPTTSRNIQILHRRMGAEAQFILPSIGSDNQPSDNEDNDSDGASTQEDPDAGNDSDASTQAEVVILGEIAGNMEDAIAHQPVNRDYEHVRRLNTRLPFEREYRLGAEGHQLVSSR